MNRTRTLLAFAAIFVGTGCSTSTLPINDSFSERYVGPWRATLASNAFSDYVFGRDGALTTLRSVMSGVSVDVMDGAGLVHNPKTGVSCAFGSTWSSPDATHMTVSGQCTDQVERDIALEFGPDMNAPAQVTVTSVASDLAWMQPVGWAFERCGLHACD